MSDLDITGERFHPTMRGVIRYEHLHRYALSLCMVDGLAVLDIASGEGYGSALLASRAKHVTGIDIDPRAVEHARRSYYRPNVRFLVGDCTAIPMADASVDVVVSFETIEHVEGHDQMLSEIRRVLRPGGMLIISSPNKLVYSDEAAFTNPYHVRELYYDEFARLLERHFRAIEIHGQRLAMASFVYPLVDRSAREIASFGSDGGDPCEGLPPLRRPTYFIAVCSNDATQLDRFASLFYDAQDDLLWSLQGDHQRALNDIAASRRGVADLTPATLSGAPPILQLGSLGNDRSREGHSGRDDDGCVEREALQAQLNALRRTNDDLRSDRDSIVAHRDALEAHRAVMAAERNAIEQDRNAIAQNRDAVVAERDAIAAKLDATTRARESLGEELAEMRHERDESRGADSLARERDLLAAQRGVLRAQCDEANAGRNSMSAKHDALAGELAVMRSERDLLALRVESLTRKLEERGTNGDLQDEEQRRASERSEELARERDVLVAECEGLWKEREEWIADRDALIAEVHSSAQRCEELEALVESEAASAARSDNDRAEVHADRMRIQRRADALARELDDLRARFDDGSRELSELRIANAQLAHSARRLLELVAVYEAQLAEVTATAVGVERFAAENRRLAEEARETRLVLERYIAEHETMKREHDAFVVSAMRDIQQLRDVTSSRSWRMTAPLREIAKKVKS